MTTHRAPLSLDRNVGWHELRKDGSRFGSLADCAQYCLPSLRACAGLLVGNRAAGDILMEEFLAGLVAGMPSNDAPSSPAEFTAAFEQFLRRTYGKQPQRIALSSGPEQIRGVWMSIDEFLDTIARV